VVEEAAKRKCNSIQFSVFENRNSYFGISGSATTHAKLHIVRMAFIGWGFESNLKDWFDYLIRGLPI
jgi:hypothetical protein